MKIFRRNLLLASSALALVMLFGCSSSEEAPPPDSSGDTYDGVDCSTYPTDEMQAECELAQEMLN
jgi:hypothetical protein